MSHVHGVGPVMAVIGAVIAFAGLAGWARLSSDGATSPDARFKRVAAFNAQASGWAKWLAAAGVVVAVIGLIVWAAS